MKNEMDFGYLGSGPEGYAQYSTLFARSFPEDAPSLFADDGPDFDAGDGDWESEP